MVKPTDLLLIGGGILAFMALRPSAAVSDSKGFGGAPGGAVDLSGIFRGLDILGRNQEKIVADQESQTATFFGLFQKQAADSSESNALLSTRQDTLFANLLGQQEASNSRFTGILETLMSSLAPVQTTIISGVSRVIPPDSDDFFTEDDKFGPETDAGNPDIVAQQVAWAQAAGNVNISQELLDRAAVANTLIGSTDDKPASESSNGALPLVSGIFDFEIPNIDFGSLLSDLGGLPQGAVEVIGKPNLNFDFDLEDLEGFVAVPNFAESLLPLGNIDLETLIPDLTDFTLDDLGLDFDIKLPEWTPPNYVFDNPFALPDFGFGDIPFKKELALVGGGILGFKFLPSLAPSIGRGVVTGGLTAATGGLNLLPKILGIAAKRVPIFALPIPDPNIVFPWLSGPGDQTEA